MASIELRNVSKVYGGNVVAVAGVDLEIADGEFMIFLGPSGCGKSTTLRMIAGLETISGGELLVGGTLMNDVEPRDRNPATRSEDRRVGNAGVSTCVSRRVP